MALLVDFFPRSCHRKDPSIGWWFAWQSAGPAFVSSSLLLVENWTRTEWTCCHVFHLWQGRAACLPPAELQVWSRAPVQREVTSDSPCIIGIIDPGLQIGRQCNQQRKSRPGLWFGACCRVRLGEPRFSSVHSESSPIFQRLKRAPKAMDCCKHSASKHRCRGAWETSDDFIHSFCLHAVVLRSPLGAGIVS